MGDAPHFVRGEQTRQSVQTQPSNPRVRGGVPFSFEAMCSMIFFAHPTFHRITWYTGCLTV